MEEFLGQKLIKEMAARRIRLTVGRGTFIADSQAIMEVYSTRRGKRVVFKEIMGKAGGVIPDL